MSYLSSHKQVDVHPDEHWGAPDEHWGAPDDDAPRRTLGSRLLGRTAILTALAVVVLAGAAYGATKVMGGSPAKTPSAGLAAAPAADVGSPAGVAPGTVGGSSDAANAGPTATAPTETAPPAQPDPATTATATPTRPANPRPIRTTTRAPAPAPAGAVKEILALVNVERSRAGCPAVTADPRLAAAAQAHAADMAAQHYFSHDSKDGSSMADRVNRAGYKWSGLGENIAKGQQTPASAMDSWMHSPDHRANILNCGYKHLGVGLARDGGSPIWVQDFGSPR
jgi:uncharacterized protein YkwD